MQPIFGRSSLWIFSTTCVELECLLISAFPTWGAEAIQELINYLHIIPACIVFSRLPFFRKAQLALTSWVRLLQAYWDYAYAIHRPNKYQYARGLFEGVRWVLYKLLIAAASNFSPPNPFDRGDGLLIISDSVSSTSLVNHQQCSITFNKKLASHILQKGIRHLWIWARDIGSE